MFAAQPVPGAPSASAVSERAALGDYTLSTPLLHFVAGMKTPMPPAGAGGGVAAAAARAGVAGGAGAPPAWCLVQMGRLGLLGEQCCHAGGHCSHLFFEKL